MKNIEKFEDLVGCVLSRTTVDRAKDEVTFELEDGRAFRLYHSQDCCESVTIVELEGEPTDLAGEVLLATEESRNATEKETDESGTWTFYRIGTIRGTVVLRWFGESNGYYSESVDFTEVRR